MKVLSFIASLAIFAFCVSAANAVPVNVALGASVTSNSEYSGCPGSRAVDGDINTNWSGSGFANPSSPMWLVIDLGDLYDVEEIGLYNGDGQHPASFFIDYNLYTSQTLSFSSPVASGRICDDSDPSCDYFDKITFADPNPIRFIKYEVFSGTHWAHLFELQALAEPANTDVPEPVSSVLLLSGLTGLGVLRKKWRK